MTIEAVVSLVPRGGLKGFSDAEVLSGTFAVMGERRIVTANLVAHLAEVERRQLHLREAYSSMYDFCVRGLGLSEGSAFRHIAGARVARDYPEVIEMLADGRLHLTALALLAGRLSAENHEELLAAAAGKSKAEIEQLLRTWFPKPDVPDCVETQPCRPSHAGAGAVSPAGQASLPADPGSAGAVAPLSEDRVVVQFSASARLKAKLEHALNLMSHTNPSRKLEPVFERALDALVRELENKKLGKTNRPRRSRGVKPGDVSREVKREVYERDGGQCTYVSESGVRCEARTQLEFDHIQPRALGGSGDAANTRLRCRPHNQLWAREVYGDETIDSRIRLRQRKPRQEKPQNEPVRPPSLTPDVHDKLFAALTTLGFRAAPVKKVLSGLTNDTSLAAPTEQLLRKAILLLTPASERR
jgi:5-methylcytosine-specific restriction endonuclease McrA